MPTFTVQQPQPAPARPRAGSPVAGFITETGVYHSLVFTPVGGELGGDAPVVESADRPGRVPVIRVTRLNARTLTFTHPIVDIPGEAAEEALQRLRGLAHSGQKVRPVRMSHAETAVWWLVADLKVSVVQRRTDQAVQEAELTWTLVEVETPPAVVSDPPPPAAAAPVTPGSSRTHTVATGDTLWAIAVRYLGSGNRYPEIARLNNLADPNRLRVGQVLRIP